MAKITNIVTKADVVVRNVPIANKIVSEDINHLVETINANDDEHILEVQGRKAADTNLDNKIFQNTAQRHNHTNKSVLDNFGQDAEGSPTFNGVKVDTTIAQRDVYDGLDSNDNTTSLSAKQGRILNEKTNTQQGQINANNDKVSNVDHPIVSKAVPSNAVFTDTQLSGLEVVAKVLSGFSKATTKINIVPSTSILSAFEALEYRVNLNDAKSITGPQGLKGDTGPRGNDSTEDLNDYLKKSGGQLSGKIYMPLSSGIRGDSVGNSNIAVFSFYESDSVTRQGYVGFGSSSNSTFFIVNDVSGKNLQLRENGELYYGDRARFIGVVSADDFDTGSDIRLKKDITELKPKRLQPVRFTWKKSGKKDIGFVADQLMVLFPEIVNIGEDSIKRVSYHKITAINSAGINFLDDQVKFLKNQNISLRNEIELIKKHLGI
jgi:hypothetical protein